MTINPEQWCDDLIKELEVDNAVKVVSQKYSADGTLLHCRLEIHDGSISFLVGFSISNEGCVSSSWIRPESDDHYFIYGSKGYILRKNKWYEYTPRDVEYYCITYLTKYLDLKPSIEDFQDGIVKMRSFWLNNDPIPQLVDLRK